MKTSALMGLGIAAMVVAAEAQQISINFCNSCLPSPPDRLVRDINGVPLVGTNYVAQLYFGGSPSTLTAHTGAPLRFRIPTTTLPGTWSGANRTIVAAHGQELYLQVRVWDSNTGATYDEARVSGSQYGEWAVFTWIACPQAPQPDCELMMGFPGIQLTRFPRPSNLAIRENGDRIDLLYDGVHTIEATTNLVAGPWVAIGAQAAPFTDPNSATLERRFYRLNDGGVYSENAVGYYRLALCNSYTMIANQFNAEGGNAVSNLFKAPPYGMRVYKFNPLSGGFTFLQYIDNEWEGNHPDLTLNPGEGIFVWMPVPYTLRFLGEVSRVPSVPLPPGFSLISSPLPVGGPVNLVPPGGVGLPISSGDRIYQWFCTSSGYFFNQFIDGAWEGDAQGATPTVAVGESFFYYNSGPPRTWSQTFGINP